MRTRFPDIKVELTKIDRSNPFVIFCKVAAAMRRAGLPDAELHDLETEVAAEVAAGGNGLTAAGEWVTIVEN